MTDNLTQEEGTELNSLLDKLSFVEFEGAGANLLQDTGLKGGKASDIIIASVQALQEVLRDK